MLCPLLQSTAVKAIVNPDDRGASQHRQRSNTECAHTHTFPVLRSRGPDKIGDGGDLSEDSTAGALHLLTDSYAWRSLKALPSHTPSLPMAHTQVHKSIDAHRDAHTLTHTSTVYIYTNLPHLLVSFLPHDPSASTTFHILMFVLPSSPPVLFIDAPQLQNA